MQMQGFCEQMEKQLITYEEALGYPTPHQRDDAAGR